jgi:hypothetical protein
MEMTGQLHMPALPLREELPFPIEMESGQAPVLVWTLYIPEDHTNCQKCENIKCHEIL